MPVTPCRAKWKSVMTDRQRFNDQMHYRPVDRCFNMEFGYWEENFRQWPIFVDSGIKDNGAADRFFSFDEMAHVGGVVWMRPPFEERLIGETATTRIYMNADGVLAESPIDGHSTIPHFSKPSVVKPDDWRRVKEERFRLDDPARRVDVESLKKCHPPDRDYPLCVGCGAMIGLIRNMLTMEGLAYATADYPDMVEDMVETACRLVENFLDQVLGKIDFDLAGGWEDICCNSGPLVTKDFFGRVIVPRYKRIGAKLRSAGIDIWYTDCDGDIRALLPGFMEAGLNTMFPWEVKGCGHPGAALDQYGRDLRIMGGVDKTVLAKRARGRREIKAYLESLAPYIARGGFIPFCDHRCPPNVPQENYLYYLDLKERMFGMR